MNLLTDPPLFRRLALVDLGARRDRITEATRTGTCPQCGKVIPEGTAIGTGRHEDGRFCSLDCVALFHGPTFVERHRRRLDASKN